MNRCLIFSLATALWGATLYGQENPFSADAKGAYTGIKNILLRAADKMPAENYSFRTVPEVRTYGEIITHIADVQFMLCGMVKGEQKQAKAPENKTKAETVARKPGYTFRLT